LEGYDLILGCDWIFEFSPVGINLKTSQFTIEKEGEKYALKMKPYPTRNSWFHTKNEQTSEEGSYGCSSLCAEDANGSI
jgi:hypothetical protein